MMETFLKAADRGAGFNRSRGLQPLQRQTNGDASKHRQDQRGIAVVHPALVLGHRDIQGVMQAALNDPIAAFELQDSPRVQFLQRQAADQVNDFGGFLAVTPHSASEPSDRAGSRKARLGRRGFLAVEHPDFGPAPVPLPDHHMRALGLRRGKNAAELAAFPEF